MAGAGSSRALVLPCKASGQTEHAVAVRLGRWDRGCRQAVCQSESISKSQLMPRLLGRSCCREASNSKTLETWDLGEAWRADRALSAAAAGLLLVIVADQILIGSRSCAASRSNQVQDT